MTEVSYARTEFIDGAVMFAMVQNSDIRQDMRKQLGHELDDQLATDLLARMLSVTQADVRLPRSEEDTAMLGVFAGRAGASRALRAAHAVIDLVAYVVEPEHRLLLEENGYEATRLNYMVRTAIDVGNLGKYLLRMHDNASCVEVQGQCVSQAGKLMKLPGLKRSQYSIVMTSESFNELPPEQAAESIWNYRRVKVGRRYLPIALTDGLPDL